jgi:chaperone modulatory protein CbpM
MKRRYQLSEVAQMIGSGENIVIRYVEYEWIQPCSREPWEFDDEDIARARLIRELTNDFGVNEEAVPIILHLLDQIHTLRQGIIAKL